MDIKRGIGRDGKRKRWGQRDGKREKERDKQGKIERNIGTKWERQKERERQRGRDIEKKIRQLGRYREKRDIEYVLLCNIYYSIILFYVIYGQKD